MLAQQQFYKPISIILVAVLLLFPYSVGAVTQTVTTDADDDSYVPGFGWSSVVFTPDFLLQGNASGLDFKLALRFQNTVVEQGVTISSATLRLYYESGSAAFVGTLYGNDVDDASAWSGSVIPSSVTKTTASASMTVPSVSFLDPVDFDVTDIVQEIVNRGGWASGNALAIVGDVAGVTAEDGRSFFSREGSFTEVSDYSLAPVLIIETASAPARVLRLKGGTRLMNGARLR